MSDIDHLATRIALALPTLDFEVARQMAEVARSRAAKPEHALMAARAAKAPAGFLEALVSVERRYPAPHRRTLERSGEMAAVVVRKMGGGE